MKKIIIYTDGGSRGNPGKAAIGVVFCNEREQIIKKYGEYLGDNLTNNEAEYSAVIFALKKFKLLFGKAIAETSDVEIRADSELVVKQLNGEYKIENEKIQKFFIEIWNLKIDFKSIKFKHILREKNKEADRLVNEALDNSAASRRLL
ncbi:MAG: ribonuclease HI family protein [Candidatus Staskawiczbacteria bacterium]|nr:ribonuclease HI family protein [Candidatus Staskawiczbacteria bacterium]